MAGQTGGSPPYLNPDKETSLKLELLKEGRAFSFFQVVRLLRLIGLRSSRKPGPSFEFAENLRIRPHLSLAFPSADIESIEESGDDTDPRFLITANFLGLYGSASPLPIFYTEDLIDEESEDESVSRDFIDILNQRLLSLLFECWMKYRQFLQVVEAKNSAHIDRLFCLLGLGDNAFRKDIPEPQRLLRYIGLFTQFPRSGTGLKTLLKDALSGTPVDVIPCVKRIAKIPESQTFHMGVSGCLLGVDSYLGDEIVDRMGKFRIQLGPLTREAFKRLSPGTESFNWFSSLTDLYFIEALEYDVEFILAQAQALTVRLGDVERATLGMDSWVFSFSELGEVRTRFSVKRH